MNELLHLLNVNTIFITILGYHMSYVEFFGTIFNLWSVWLVARKNIWNWPVGIIGVILFFALFYQIHLYADQFEQLYFFITGFWGWYAWYINNKKHEAKDDEDLYVERNSKRANVYWLIGVIAFSCFTTWVLTHVNVWWPRFFPEPASLPVVDATTTVMSFAATILMIRRRVENWHIWIAVDVVSIWLYVKKGVPFVALLYVVFLGLAIQGLIIWKRAYKKQEVSHGKRTSDRQVLPTTQRP